jgi:hypothetical protein
VLRIGRAFGYACESCWVFVEFVGRVKGTGRLTSSIVRSVSVKVSSQTVCHTKSSRKGIRISEVARRVVHCERADVDTD